MKKQQFNLRGHYVSPSCEAVMLKTNRAVLEGTYDGMSGLRNIDDVEDDSGNDHSKNWGW